jgi:zinc/manganese transport system ATP-binding protein
LIGWGPTEEVMSPSNLLRARTMAERWDENSDICEAAQ